MKRKKPSLFSPIILFSFTLITLITLLPLIVPKSPNSPKPLNSPTSPKISSPSKSSFLNLITHPRLTTQNSQPTTLIAVGDIMLGRYCNVQMLQKNDWKYPFLKTADIISNADIAFGNLEAPIVQNCPATETGMVFCARPESIEGLKFTGFDILSIANNHILNHGQKGLEQTINLLTSNRILPSAETLTSYKLQANQLKFGFLAFDLVTYPKTLVVEQVKENASKANILIVSLHWGNEYQKQPTANQVKLGHQIIDAGAKIIIGHHPHVTQPVEEYNNGLIFYSLGNFVFDQPWSEETKKGNLAKIIFEGKNIKSYELTPTYIENYCQPKLLQ